MKFKTKLVIEIDIPENVAKEIEEMGFSSKLELAKSHFEDIEHLIKACIAANKVSITGSTAICEK